MSCSTTGLQVSIAFLLALTPVLGGVAYAQEPAVPSTIEPRVGGLSEKLAVEVRRVQQAGQGHQEDQDFRPGYGFLKLRVHMRRLARVGSPEDTKENGSGCYPLICREGHMDGERHAGSASLYPIMLSPGIDPKNPMRFPKPAAGRVSGNNNLWSDLLFQFIYRIAPPVSSPRATGRIPYLTHRLIQ